MDAPAPIPLAYTIAGCSEHSGVYVAENILVDNPLDQASRWSGAYQSPNVKQWMLLRLANLTILKSITFGKYYKPHPCNMKEFKVFVGLTEDNMTEVLHAGLKNDSAKEIFSIRHINRAGICFPTRYVKIIPLSAHGQSFHTSIWHVALSGIVDEAYVQRIRERHDEYREASVLRHVLKHLRQRRFLTPFDNILSSSGLQLEHPLVTDLYDSLVLKGDWSRAEALLPTISSSGLFDSYRHACQPRARWAQVHGLDADGDAPIRRGGHAMCMDEQNGLIYLFGGWDGLRSLDDFWVYDVRQDTWEMLSLATSREQNGPGPRACHKMVFDKKTGSIYLLGRLGDGDALEPAGTRGASGERSAPSDSARPTTPGQSDSTVHGGEPSRSRNVTPLPWSSYCSEFYRYHTRGLDAGKWDLLLVDTGSSGGPQLIFDHQMLIDSEAEVIYVSGGRVVDADWELCKYSGLYAYDIRAGSWEALESMSDSSVGHPYIPPRFGHSMVFEPNTRNLLIFAGQRDDKYLSDMYAYHIPSGTVTELFSNFTASGGPDACFTQRAVIDPELREIYVFCGLTRNRTGLTILETESPHWIYRYDRPDRPGQWTKIPPAQAAQSVAVRIHDETQVIKTPQARYAHQVVYDTSSKVVFMHGGNAGIIPADGRNPYAPAGTSGSAYALEGPDAARESRLDDFWKMQLERPPLEDIVRRAKSEIRQQQFREMCEDVPPVKALTFLQTEVSSVVDHSNPQEEEVFRSLLTHLLALPPKLPPSQSTSATPSGSTRRSGFGTARDAEKSLSGSIVLDEDEDMKDSPDNRTCVETTAAAVESQIRPEEDPQEVAPRVSAAPSAARFKKRTQVFEKLLTFVNEDAKQPDKNLLDLINTDE